MEFILNNSPTLTMVEITKLLFNRDFLSDVQFHVAGKTIYAHSLELMKRSIVFQKQLATTLGVHKLIPINNASYDNVYEFVRYIYTDECKIDNSNAIELLHLAKRYKVIKFENKIIRVLQGVIVNLSLFEYCLLHNEELQLLWARNAVWDNLRQCLSSDEFLTVHPFVIEEILSSNHVDASELEIFTGLARWIDQHNKDNKIDVDQQRDYYNRYLHLVRFPVIPVDETLKIISKYSIFLNDSDLDSILKESDRPTDQENQMWNSVKRNPYPDHFILSNKVTVTILTVSHEMLLTGIRFGYEINNRSVELIIIETNLDMGTVKKLKIHCPGKLNFSSHLINLGGSIRLQPNMEYSIEFKYHPVENKQLKVTARKKTTNMYTNVSSSLVRFKQASRNIYEIYFAEPE